MKYKFLLALFFGIMLFGLVSSADCPVVKQGEPVELITVCDNCMQVNLTKVTYPNSSFVLLGQFPMTQNGTNYNYTLDSGYVNTLGIYEYVSCGDLSGIVTWEDEENNCFQVTNSGRTFDEGQGITSTGILFGAI